MTHTPSRRIAMSCVLGTAIFALPLLIGCQGPKIVAKVNDKNILADDYNTQVQQVRGQTLAQTSLDAGGYTLASMVETTLITSLASDPPLHAAASDDKVKNYVALMKRMHPEINDQIKKNLLNDTDLYRQIKTIMEMHTIGTDGAAVSDSDLQEAYDDLKNKGQLDFPTLYTLRLLPLPDAERANQALEQLKKTKNFNDLGPILGLPPDQAAKIAQSTVFSARQLPPDLIKALDQLTPDQFTPQPIANTATNPNNPAAPSQTQYIIAQLIAKEPGKTPQIPEIRSFLEQMALEHKFPLWKTHEDKLLAEYTLKAKIEIFIPRYQSVVNDTLVAAARSTRDQNSAPPTAMPQGGPGPGR